MKKPVEVEVLDCEDEEHAQCQRMLRDDLQTVLWAFATKHGADGGLDVEGDPIALVTKQSTAEIVAYLALLMGHWGETLRQMGVTEREIRELIAANHKIGRESAAENEVELPDRSKLN